MREKDILPYWVCHTCHPDLVDHIPDLEEVRHGTEALPTLESDRTVRTSVEVETSEKDCASVSVEVGKLLVLVSCGHRCICADCSELVVGHPCPVCRTGDRQTIRVFD